MSMCTQATTLLHKHGFLYLATEHTSDCIRIWWWVFPQFCRISTFSFISLYEACMFSSIHVQLLWAAASIMLGHMVRQESLRTWMPREILLMFCDSLHDVATRLHRVGFASCNMMWCCMFCSGFYCSVLVASFVFVVLCVCVCSGNQEEDQQM